MENEYEITAEGIKDFFDNVLDKTPGWSWVASARCECGREYFALNADWSDMDNDGGENYIQEQRQKHDSQPGKYKLIDDDTFAIFHIDGFEFVGDCICPWIRKMKKFHDQTGELQGKIVARLVSLSKV